MMKNTHLLNQSGIDYMERVLTDPELIQFFKNNGKRYATIEYSIIDSSYKFFVVDNLIPTPFRGEIVEYVEL